MSQAISSQIMRKVTGFVTRKRVNQMTELLVFQHPTAGVQLPAGTVEQGESWTHAVLREVAEETGLTEVCLVGILGSTDRILANGARAVMQPTTLLSGPRTDATPLNWTLGRGSPCRLVSEADDFAEVVYEETNLNVIPNKVRIRLSGWVPTNVLTERVERHFYHLELTGTAPERWVQEAERLFECYWTPLVPKPVLNASQKEWIDLVYEKLLRSSNP